MDKHTQQSLELLRNVLTDYEKPRETAEKDKLKNQGLLTIWPLLRG